MRCAETFDLADLNISTIDLPANGERIIRDAKVSGLALRLRSSGARTWVLLAKEGGKIARRTLGDAKLIPLKSVRQMASADVAAASKDDAAAPTAALFASDARVAEVLARYLAFGAQGRWKHSTGRLMESIARSSILPVLGRRRVRDITPQEVACWHRDISAQTTSARMALSTLSGMMLYAEDHGMRPAGSNPCRGLRKKEVGHRGRHPSPDTVRRLWQALDHLQERMPDACDAVRLLLLTGARRSEILGLTWDCIVGPRAVLADSKTGPHVIWLNTPARVILDARREEAESPFVFPASKREGPITVIDRQWATILKKAGIASLRVHDLRHHYASVAVSNGIDLRVVGQLLGHRDIDSTLGYAHLATGTLVKSANRVSALIDRSMKRGTDPKRSPACRVPATITAPVWAPDRETHHA